MNWWGSLSTTTTIFILLQVFPSGSRDMLLRYSVFVSWAGCLLCNTIWTSLIVPEVLWVRSSSKINSGCQCARPSHRGGICCTRLNTGYTNDVWNPLTLLSINVTNGNLLAQIISSHSPAASAPLCSNIQQKDIKRETSEGHGDARGKSSPWILFKTSSFLDPLTTTAHGTWKALALQKGWHGHSTTKRQEQGEMDAAEINFTSNTNTILLILSSDSVLLSCFSCDAYLEGEVLGVVFFRWWFGVFGGCLVLVPLF